MIVSNILLALFFMALGLYLKLNPEKVMDTWSDERKQKVNFKALGIFYIYSLVLLGFLLFTVTTIFHLLQVNMNVHIIASASVFILFFAIIVIGQLKYLKR